MTKIDASVSNRGASMATKGAKVAWWSELSVNAEAEGWKMRLAEKLRDWADRIDGRRSLALGMMTYPQISESDEFDVIRQGVKEMQKSLHDAAENEASERKWKEVAPEMWHG